MARPTTRLKGRRSDFSGRGSNLQALIDAAADLGPTRPKSPCAGHQQPCRGGGARPRRPRRGPALRRRRARTVRLSPPGPMRRCGGAARSWWPGPASCATISRQPRRVEAWRDRLVNIHPSLLPAFQELHPQRAGLALGGPECGSPAARCISCAPGSIPVADHRPSRGAG